MEKNNTLEILKQAILLEKRGKVFYRKVAENTENRELRDVFEMMATEEDKHINTLSEQFKAYRQEKKFPWQSQLYRHQQCGIQGFNPGNQRENLRRRF